MNAMICWMKHWFAGGFARCWFLLPLLRAFFSKFRISRNLTGGWHSWDTLFGRSKIEAIAFYVLFMCISRLLRIPISFFAPDKQNRMGRNHRASHQGAHVRQSHHGRVCLGSTRSKYKSLKLYIYIHMCISKELL